MTADGLLNLLLLLGTWCVAAWIVVIGVPMVARVRLVAQAGELRDRVSDARLTGEVPLEDNSVKRFIDVTDFLMRHPEFFGLSEALAAHAAREALGLPPAPPPSYANLTTESRRLMKASEQQLIQEIRHYIVFGSRFWPLLIALRVLHPILSNVRPAARIVHMSMDELARDARCAAAKGLGGFPSGSSRLAGAL